LPLANAAGEQHFDLGRMLTHSRGSAVGSAFLARLDDASLHPIAEDVTFELGLTMMFGGGVRADLARSGV
jgi:hypothetical protein